MSECQTVPLSEPVTPPSRPIVLPGSPSSTSLHYFSHPGDSVTDELLKECATLFGENYGVWRHNPTSHHDQGPQARFVFSLVHFEQY